MPSLSIIWHLCHEKIINQVFHYKHDPVIERYIEAYFLSSMKLEGDDYYVKHSSTNNSTTYANICL